MTRILTSLLSSENNIGYPTAAFVIHKNGCYCFHVGIEKRELHRCCFRSSCLARLFQLGNSSNVSYSPVEILLLPISRFLLPTSCDSSFSFHSAESFFTLVQILFTIKTIKLRPFDSSKEADPPSLFIPENLSK